MILGGGDGAATGRTRRWVLFTLVFSILALVGGLVLVLLLSQFYIVPHMQSDDFVQTQCYVRSIEIIHIKKEGKVSRFDNPNCDEVTPATKRPGKPNFDDFDFTLSGTTSHPPGFYPTKPSGIFKHNYGSQGNRRTFPDRTVRKARPSNVYRTNNWDPFDTNFQARALPQHAPPPSPPPAPAAQARMQGRAHHPGLPLALAPAQARAYPGRARRSPTAMALAQTEPDGLLPRALAQYAQTPSAHLDQNLPDLSYLQDIQDRERYAPRGRRKGRKAPAPGPGPSPGARTGVAAPTARSQEAAPRDCSKGFVQEGTLCVHVSVLFRGLDGFVALGTLYADQKSLPKANTTSALGWPTKKCICDGCTITALSGNGSSVDEILVGKTNIRQGTRTRCYYPMAGGGHLLIFRTSNIVALHAILWPTLVFVSGFVGLFFSCLIIQKQRQQQRKQQTRPPMAYV